MCTCIMRGGGVLLNHHQCVASTWMMRRLPQDNGASVLTTHQLQVERRESHRANQVYTLTTHQLQVERRESHRANQVYTLTTHQLQVERRERVIETIKCMRSPHTSYRWRELIVTQINILCPAIYSHYLCMNNAMFWSTEIS